MGEYAFFAGGRIKIGTCENMYYLRADQRKLVRHEEGSVDPIRDGDAGEIRFRFPFPDEDDVRPGAFNDHARACVVSGVKVPEGVEHGTLQFRHDAGYLVSLPCPEGPEPQPFKIHRNGFSGSVRIVQQRFFDSRLITVCECGGCDWPYRLETIDDARPVIRALVEEAARRERFDKGSGDWQAKIADRIAAGYAL
jgi:hypothetical protein